jgi:PDZ domain/Aspartyl protease
MSVRDFGLHACGQGYLSATSIRFVVYATLAVSGLAFAIARTSLAFPPQEVPRSKAQIVSSTAKSDKAGTDSRVPFEMLPSNHMLVEARINEKGPYHLIFDLGAPITLLSNRVSEAAQVIKPGSPRSFLFGMRGEAEVNTLQVGELKTSKLPVIVLDHPVLAALEEMTGRQIDGLMGFTFFARYKTTIDYHAHQMTFTPIDYQVRDLMKELPDRLLGPQTTRRRVLAPSALWGFRLGESIGGLESPGVPIIEVYVGSAAARAGLRSGDVLTSINGRWTTSIVDVFHAAVDVIPDCEATVAIRRDGKEQVLTIRPSDGA